MGNYICGSNATKGLNWLILKMALNDLYFSVCTTMRAELLPNGTA